MQEMLWSDPFLPLIGATGRTAAFVPPADVAVAEGDLVLTMDVPGLGAEDLEIQLLDGELTVRGERKRPEVPEGATWAHSERSFGRFERRIRLPEGVDADRVMANLENGVLSLIVPKPERLKPRTITVGEAESQRQLEGATA